MIGGQRALRRAAGRWSRGRRRGVTTPLIETSIFAAPRLQRRPRLRHRLLRRDGRHAARAHPVPAVRRALLGHPRRRDARAVRRGLGGRRGRRRHGRSCPASAAAPSRSPPCSSPPGRGGCAASSPRTGWRPVRPLLIGAQLVLGAGIGMLVSPLFDFILASVKDHEVGSASGVLNAVQQLASAIGVAAIGTVFFAALARSGFTAAIRECLTIELGVAAVLLVLARALPRTASGMTPMPAAADPGCEPGSSRSTAPAAGEALNHNSQLTGKRRPIITARHHRPRPRRHRGRGRPEHRRPHPVLPLAAGGRRHRGLDQVPAPPLPPVALMCYLTLLATAGRCSGPLMSPDSLWSFRQRNGFSGAIMNDVDLVLAARVLAAQVQGAAMPGIVVGRGWFTYLRTRT